MVCTQCGRPASKYQIAAGGKTREAVLCPACYAALTAREGRRCPACGMTLEEYRRTGLVGCAECYHTFRGQLLPIIQRIHGTAQHKGKVPGSSALRVTDTNNKIVAVEETPLEEKKRLLKQAIEVQDFERAAVLRDEIKELEQHG